MVNISSTSYYNILEKKPGLFVE